VEINKGFNKILWNGSLVIGDELRRPAQSLGKAPKPGLKPCQEMSKVLKNGTKMTGALFYKS